MPLYEYECLKCGKRTEVLQRFDDAPLAACPNCGGEVKKLLSAPAVQFKGSGWYVTDYAGKKGGSSSSSKSESKSDDSGSSSEKADKPKEAAAESKSPGTSGSSGSSE